MLFLILSLTSALASAGKDWNSFNVQEGGNHLEDEGGGGGGAGLERLEVVCSKDHMTVHVHFARPFHGVVFSHGTSRQERCVHVGPRAGVNSASFDIRYDGCGTVEDVGGRFHENTIVIQSDEAILEAWDEAKRLRCEWLESFEKHSLSRPTLSISELDVVELNFQGDDIDCWMEVQEGKGPWSRQVGGLVPVGNPLTLVVAINDHSREFDLRIKRCTAGDGSGSNEIELTDSQGCVLRPSLLTPFAKVRDFGHAGRTLVAYSHLFAFKFPDKMDVFVHCVVEVCRHGCPDACATRQKQQPEFAGAASVRRVTASKGKPQPQVRLNASSHVPRATFKPFTAKKVVDVQNGLGPSKGVHRLVGHDVHWISEDLGHHHHHQHHRATSAPRPEPAPWSADDVFPKARGTPLYHLNEPFVTKMQWGAGDDSPRPRKATATPSVPRPEPQPEPGPWTLEEVRPVHRPEPQPVHRPVPQPEPGPWTFQDVRGLSGEDLRLLSLNHKMGSTGAPPVHGTPPRPVYVPAGNVSMTTMRMMMMPTMLPVTYQTALWRRHRYPYPVPQFSPQGQRLMMSVIGDRRMDDEEDLSPNHRRPEPQTSSRIRIGETASGEPQSDRERTEPPSEDLSPNHRGPEPQTSRIRIGETASGDDASAEPQSDRSLTEPPSDSVRLERRRRSSEPVFAVRQSFRAIAPSDLAFDWNLTSADGATVVYRGRRYDEDVVYGVCVSPVGLGAGVGLVLVLTLLFAVASVVLYEHACRLAHRTSQLAFFTRNLDGRFETLYRITRPYLCGSSDDKSRR